MLFVKKDHHRQIPEFTELHDFFSSSSLSPYSSSSPSTPGSSEDYGYFTDSFASTISTSLPLHSPTGLFATKQPSSAKIDPHEDLESPQSHLLDFEDEMTRTMNQLFPARIDSPKEFGSSENHLPDLEVEMDLRMTKQNYHLDVIHKDKLVFNDFIYTKVIDEGDGIGVLHPGVNFDCTTRTSVRNVKPMFIDQIFQESSCGIKLLPNEKTAGDEANFMTTKDLLLKQGMGFLFCLLDTQNLTLLTTS